MKEVLIVTLLGIFTVFSGLFLIFIVISLLGRFFQKEKILNFKKSKEIKKVKVTNDVLAAIGLALYFHEVFNKNWQDEVTIQKLTPPMSTWVVAGRGITMGKFIWSYRRKWR